MSEESEAPWSAAEPLLSICHDSANTNVFLDDLDLARYDEDVAARKARPPIGFTPPKVSN